MADMRHNYTQSMQQQQRMTPQMIQSIALMSIPVDELCERIYNEVEKNPALEIVKDAQLEHRSVHRTTRSSNSSASDDWQAFLESAPSHAESLQEHLLFQLALLSLTNDERRIGERVIQNLDSHGFNGTDPENLLTVDDPLSRMAKMIGIVRRFDPQGTACANFQESLLVQAEFSKNAPPLALTILRFHVAILEKKRPPLICKTLQEAGVECSLEEVVQAIEFIRSLEPWPARQFNSVDSGIQYVVPEILVRRITGEDDLASMETKEEHILGFVIEFLRGNLPQIELSPVYTQIVKEKKNDESTRKFALEAVQEAKGFINALSERTKSIHEAVRSIVIKQHAFFDKGPGNLLPLRLKDIAKEIGRDESTISRISNGKYLQCDWGLFEIKYFFTNAVQSTRNPSAPVSGDSKESVKHQLRLLIEENEKSGVKKLSDAKLVILLDGKGISIARRTIAKYRSELKIESSFDRI